MKTARDFVQALKRLDAFAYQPMFAKTEAEVEALAEKLIEGIEADITHLHMACQGAAHYSGCAKNAANTGVLVDECPRCEAERLRVENAILREHLVERPRQASDEDACEELDRLKSHAQRQAEDETPATCTFEGHHDCTHPAIPGSDRCEKHQKPGDGEEGIGPV
jgi:hypothetical protein